MFDSFALSTTFQAKHAKATPLLERCQAICEKVYGSEHRLVATTLDHRAGLLREQVRAAGKKSWWY